MKAKKAEKKDNSKRRRKVKKGRLIVCLIAVFALVIAVLFILLKTKLFPVKNITAGGSELYTQEEIIDASGITDTTPLFSISEDKILKQIQSKLTYIETVTVKRGFPDTVELTVSDATEYFAFETEQGYFAAGENCRVLNCYEQLPENLIKSVVPGIKLELGKTVEFKSDEQKDLFNLLAQYIKEKGIKLNSIDLTDSLHITIGVEGRFEVLLGINENIRAKIDHLAVMVKEIGEQKGRINLEMWSKTDAKGTFVAGN